jgi:hypothetical protein
VLESNGAGKVLGFERFKAKYFPSSHGLKTIPNNLKAFCIVTIAPSLSLSPKLNLRTCIIPSRTHHTCLIETANPTQQGGRNCLDVTLNLELHLS